MVRVVSQTIALAQLSLEDVVSEVDAITPEKMFDICLQKQEAAGTVYDSNLKKQLTDAYGEILEIVRANGGEK